MGERSIIDGMKIVPLKQIRDDRGMIMHMLRSDSELFDQFGEIYFSVVNSGVVKGWRKHTRMIQNYAVPKGAIKFVFYDVREGSSTKNQICEVEAGIDDYKLIKVPPGIWYSFKAISSESAMIVNCASIPHDPTETESADLHHDMFPFRWD